MRSHVACDRCVNAFSDLEHVVLHVALGNDAANQSRLSVISCRDLQVQKVLQACTRFGSSYELNAS